MPGKRTYQFTILAKIDEATKSINSFSNSTQEQFDKLNFRTAITSIQSGISIAQTLAGKIQNAFGYAIEQALEAEKNVTQLNNAMRLSGEYSAYASQRMQDYAESLAQVTVYSKDQVLAAINIAKTYGLVNSEARKVAEVAADLAARTDGDLNGAIRDLAQTFNGFLSKELVKIAPELKRLTKEQLAAGEAVRIFAEKVRGSAAEAVNTYAGELANAKKTVDDFYQVVGDKALKVTAFLIRDTYALGRNLKAVANEFVAAAARMTAPTADLAEKGKSLFEVASDATRRARQKQLEDQKEADAQRKAVNDRIREAQAQEAKAELASIKGQLLGIRLASLNEVERINLDFQEKAKVVNKAFAGGLIKQEEEKNKILAGLDAQRLKQVGEAQDALLAKQAAKLQKFAQNTADAFEEAIRKGTKIGPEEGLAAGLGFANQMLKGIEGARQLLGGVAGAVANYFLPGAGAAVSQIVQELSKGPDYVVKMMREFREALPQLVENIATSIPALVEAFIKDTPRIIDKIIEMLPRVMQAFVEGIPTIISELIKAIPHVIASLVRAMPTLIVEAAKGFVDFFIKGWPMIVKALIQAIVEGVPQIIEGFYKGLVGAAEAFVDALMDALKSVGGLFGGNGGGGGIGGFFSDVGDFIGDAVGSIGDVLGLAEGGRTANDSRLVGDRGLVRIGPNEQTFRGDLTDRLERYLDSNEGGGATTTVQLILDRRVLAEATYKNRKAGYRQ